MGDISISPKETTNKSLKKFINTEKILSKLILKECVNNFEIIKLTTQKSQKRHDSIQK